MTGLLVKVVSTVSSQREYHGDGQHPGPYLVTLMQPRFQQHFGERLASSAKNKFLETPMGPKMDEEQLLAPEIHVNASRRP